MVKPESAHKITPDTVVWQMDMRHCIFPEVITKDGF